MRRTELYRSGFEHRIANDLAARGIAFTYETLTLDYLTRVRSGQCSKCDCRTVHQRRKYTPDFIISTPNHQIIVEAKGVLDSPTRSKMRDISAANPKADIRFLFDGKPTWARSKKMAEWADKYGFPYAFGHELPEEWLI